MLDTGHFSLEEEGDTIARQIGMSYANRPIPVPDCSPMWQGIWMTRERFHNAKCDCSIDVQNEWRLRLTDHSER